MERVDRTFWEERWESGRTGWHRAEVHPALVRHAGLLGDAPGRVLVPLCGKSLDMAWLAERGDTVLGVDLVPRAARAFFEEQGIAARRVAREGLEGLEGGGVTIWCADVLDVRRAHVPGVDRAWDRGALVALPPALRDAYVAHLFGLISGGGRVLLATLSYDQELVDGPPFSVPPAEVERLFAGAASVELLEEDPRAQAPPRFRESGVETVVERIWLLALSPGGR